MKKASQDLTAAHYNTPQHTATHCNTLQRTATHCNTLRQVKGFVTEATQDLYLSSNPEFAQVEILNSQLFCIYFSCHMKCLLCSLNEISSVTNLKFDKQDLFCAIPNLYTKISNNTILLRYQILRYQIIPRYTKSLY